MIIELIYYFLHTVISVGFGMSSYNVQENAGTVDDLVFVIKLNDMQSERILNVLLDVSVVGTAERGQLLCYIVLVPALLSPWKKRRSGNKTIATPVYPSTLNNSLH